MPEPRTLVNVIAEAHAKWHGHPGRVDPEDVAFAHLVADEVTVFLLWEAERA